MRILLADDHSIVRQGLRTILAEEFEAAEFGEAKDTRQALTLMQEQPWDVVILDVTMPGSSGMEALRQIKDTYPQVPVLVLSMHPEDQYAARAFREGAAGYLTKETAPDELAKAARQALDGGKYVSPSFAETLAFDLLRHANGPPHEWLSARERQVMCMIASGKTTTQIANELSLSTKTVSTYRSRTLEKMRMSTNAELARYAIENQLIA